MIGLLPTALEIAGKPYPIDSDYRTMLRTFEALNDPDLTEQEKCYVMLKNLYRNPENIPRQHIEEAAEKAVWFADGGECEKSAQGARILDWKQDERIIFPAINKAAGCEVRGLPYLHWWTFLGLFGEVGEGLLTQVISIRRKRSKGKKLDKWEQEFLNEHRSLINLKKNYSQEELAEQEKLNALLD